MRALSPLLLLARPDAATARLTVGAVRGGSTLTDGKFHLNYGRRPDPPDPPDRAPPKPAAAPKEPTSARARPQLQAAGAATGAVAARLETALRAMERVFDDELFLYETPGMQWVPSEVYRFSGFFDGLQIMHQQGIADKTLYVGGDDPACAHCHVYGLINVAAFLAQAMKETIRYDACDENSWDRVGPLSAYPIANSCGQLRQSYQDYRCSDEEKHMECAVDPEMTLTAVTNAKWWGAPGPLTCGPRSALPQTGYWNYNGVCDDVWATPPKYCTAYAGQKGGAAENAAPYANAAGRTDVEGCCWWGRGVIQTTGVCNFGKLNYFLGKRAADEGRDAQYPDIDFCRDPEAICSSEEHQELKWIAGFFYYVESVQAYAAGGWNYMAELHKFVDGGLRGDAFINAVSGIVNRGCHNPPCGTGALDGGPERAQNFFKIVQAMEFSFVDVPAPSMGARGEGSFLDFLDLGDGGAPAQDCADIGTGTEAVEKAFLATKDAFDDELFLYETPGMQWVPSSVYRFDGFFDGLKIMHSQGIAGKKLYMGGDGKECKHCHMYGLVNVAAFLAQAMKETIRYDACDENSWDRVGLGKMYPIANSCGQLEQSYQDYHCSDEEKHMECEVDPEMTITAVTNARWWGAPGPLTCGPKSLYPQTGHWDFNGVCDDIWANPPKYCTDYEGQKGGTTENGKAYANRAGRTDVEGCCWWGRGVIQTTGVCNFGKLNYFLGKRAADEGRDAKYPNIDFCRDPEAICSSKEHKELKWIAGFFYYVESVQSYDEGGWNYMAELHKFVNEGMQGDAFINAVSGIVNRGCHNPPCGTGALDGGHERADNFNRIIKAVDCAFVDVEVKTLAPVATEKDISTGFTSDLGGNDNSPIDQASSPEQSAEEPPEVLEEPPEVLYECDRKHDPPQSVLRSVIDFYYELYVSIEDSVGDCLKIIKKLLLEDVATILGCSNTGGRRRHHRRLQGLGVITQLMSDKTDLPDPDAQGCISEFDSMSPTTCTPVKGKFTVSFMPDTTDEARKNLVDSLKNIVKKGMDSGRYESAGVDKAIYVGDIDAYVGDSNTASSELIPSDGNSLLKMTIYFLSGTCVLLFAAFCYALKTRKDRAKYQAGDETSFVDFMMQGDGASFDDMPPNVQAGYPYGSEQGQNGEVIAPGVSEFAEPAEREAHQPRFNPAPREIDTRGKRSQSKSKSRSRSKRESLLGKEPVAMEALSDYLCQTDEVPAPNLDQVDIRRTRSSRSKIKPQIDLRAVKSGSPRSQSAPTPQPDEESSESGESSSSSDASSSSSANSGANDGSDLLQASSTPSRAVSPKVQRQRRVDAARERAIKRRSFN